MVSGSISTFISAVSKTGGCSDALIELVENSQEMLTRNVSSLDAVIEEFDIYKFTILHACLLKIKYASHSNVDKTQLISQTVNFFENCDPECIHKIPHFFRIVSQEFTSLLISLNIPIKGVLSLINIIKKLKQSEHYLTPFHLALAAKHFSLVIPVLNVDILEIDRSTSALEAKDFLLYFYYGGLIYAAVKDWGKSLHFFELCLIIPAVSLSCILIEAAKKIILISLIHNGKFTALPDVPVTYFISPRSWKSYCQTYLELASVFRSNSPEKLSTYVNHNRHVFISDNNFGLVKQVLKYHVKYCIHNLTKTFMTMSLADVAVRVGLSGAHEAETYIVDMIKSGLIFARIDQRNETVYFLDDPEQYDSLNMLRLLHEKIEQCTVLEKHLLNVSDNLTKSPCYAKRMLELECKSTKPSGQY